MKYNEYYDLLFSCNYFLTKKGELMLPFDNKRINDRPAMDPATIPVSKKAKHTHESLEMKVEEVKNEAGGLATDPHAKYQQLKDKYEKLSKKIQILQDFPPEGMSEAEINQKIYKQTQKLNKLYEETIKLGIELELNVPDMEVEEAAIPQIPSGSAVVVSEMEIKASSQAPVADDNLLKKHNLFKKQCVESIKNFKTVNEFRNFFVLGRNLPLEYQKLADQAFLDPAVSPVKLNFIVITKNGSSPQTLNLPLSQWKAHGDYFMKLIESSMEETALCQDTMSLHAHNAFMAALHNCSSSGLLNLNVLPELSKVADKYQIAWLCHDCDQYYKEVYKSFEKYNTAIVNLLDAVKFGKSPMISVVSICQYAEDLLKNNKLSQSDKKQLLKQLNELADKFKLDYLKFFAKRIENPGTASMCLNGFGKGSQEELVASYNDILESYIELDSIKKNAETLMSYLSSSGITHKQELVDILLRIADFRPDLVRENLDKFNLNESDIDEIKSICTLMELSLANVKINSLREGNLVFTGYSARKIRNAVRIQPNSEMQKIFDLFKSIAENPEVELTGRTQWNIAQECESDEDMIAYCLNMLAPRQIRRDTKERTCGFTVPALELSIFGKQNPQTNKLKLEKDSLNQAELNKFWSTVKENENLLDDTSRFFAYTMELTSLDHTFMVFQYKDEQDNVKYRILQSWVDHHSLNDYMVHRGDDLTSDEFMDFINGFNHVLLHDKWTNEKRDFYKDYFMKEENSPKSARRKRETRFSCKWGSSNLNHVLVQKAQFEDFKEKYIIKLMQKA